MKFIAHFLLGNFFDSFAAWSIMLCFGSFEALIIAIAPERTPCLLG